jgi:hypothetical protein
MRDVRADRLLDIPSVANGHTLVAATIGPDGDPILLTTAAREPNHLTVHHVLAGGARIECIDLPAEGLLYPMVQPLGAEEWLLVGTVIGDGPTARVFDRKGRPLRSFDVGDGVESVQVSPSGEIWVSYFDEGIFGRSALAAEGVVCLDAAGQVLHTPTTNQLRLPPIIDCYAMNVCRNGDVWLFYYDAFPLVRIRNGRVQTVVSNVPHAAHYAKAVAVHGDDVLFGGRYDGKSDLLVRYSLRTRQAEELLLRGPEGECISYERAFGRDCSLYFVAGDSLLSVDLRTV